MDPNKGYCHGGTHQSSSSSHRGGGSNSGINNGNEMVPKGKTTLNLPSGNYINVVPVPIGVQYHRRKLTPQEYHHQSRLYYNSHNDYTRDAKCREDFYSIGCSTNSTPNGLQSSSLSQSSGISSAASSASASCLIPQQQHHQHLQQQITHHQSHHHPHQQHQQTDIIDQAINNSRVVATQTNNCDQLQTQPVPPVLYTVHRVVTTAQIQTAVGGAFAASSSVSSVVSAIRNEAVDCSQAAIAAAVASGSNSIGGGIGPLGSNALHNNSPGVSTNANYQNQQQHVANSTEMQQTPSSISSNFNPTPSASANYPSGAKSSTSIPRPLQNVIPTCVYLMSRIAVHMEIEGTAQCPAQVMLAAALGCEELGIANKLLAQSIFGLWMTSALLEIQLKSHHRPYVVRVAWPNLLDKFSQGNPIEKRFDEPMIVLRRNVFFSKKDEEKIKDHRIIELLYEEAKHNVLNGRYIMESVHSIMLGGIQARIELGPYNSHTHTITFFRENQSRFLPPHVAKSSSWSWLPVSRKNSAEIKLLEQYKRVPQSATTRKLMRKYLEFCWALPFYGAAFFHGQVEQPVRGLMSFISHKDISVTVAINERGVFIIEPVECTLLLGLRYEDLSWDYAKPSSNDDLDCQTCIFLQFDAVENGIAVSKLMQIFSRQAAMMDALIAHFAEQMRRRKEAEVTQHGEHHIHEEPNPIQNNGNGVLCNKLSRLVLATFDEEGRCIGQMGSLSISY